MSVLVPCAGAVVFDGKHRLLLVLRGNEPAAGTWSLPGGRQEAGETPAACAEREVAEETGLQVVAERLLGVVLRPGAGVVYEIHDYACRLTGGRARAGDDARDVVWADSPLLDRLPLAPGLRSALEAFGVLPERPGDGRGAQPGHVPSV